MSRVVTLGVIGAGPIASKHLDVIAAMEGVTVSALSSRRPGPRDDLARRYGIPRQFDTSERLLEENLDGVMVLVAPEAIAEVAATSIARGFATFLEKPPGLTLRDAEALAELAERHRVVTQVGLNRRFYSVVKTAREAIDRSGQSYGCCVEAPESIARARAAGRPERLLRHWVAANSLHAIDLLRFLSGNVRTRHVLRRTGAELAELSIAALLEFESGAIGQYTAYWGSPGRWSVSLYGRDVTAVLTPFERGRLSYADGREEEMSGDDVDVRFKPGFYRQMEAFIDALRTGHGAPPAADLADAARSMELADWLAGGAAR